MLAGLLAFRRLDLLLAAGVRAARVRFGPDAARDNYRGMYVTEDQALHALGVPVGEPLVSAVQEASEQPPDWSEIIADNPCWAWLRDRFSLTERELDIVLIALGPDLDRRYEQLYGFLQDDVAVRRPSVDLMLGLLTATPNERLSAAVDFTADAPLLRQHLITLPADPRATEPPLIARQVVVDDQVAGRLLGRPGLDARLTGCCERITSTSTEAAYAAEKAGELTALEGWLRQAWGNEPVRLCFHGPAGTGRRDAALRLAENLGHPTLMVSAPALAGTPQLTAELIRIALRQAEFDNAMVYLHDADALSSVSGHHGPDVLIAALATYPGVVVLGTAAPWTPTADEPLGVIGIGFDPPGSLVRRQLWRTEVEASGASARLRDLAAVADRFRLSRNQIRDAARTATGTARLTPQPAPDRLRLTSRELFAAARRQGGRELTAFARWVRPIHGWDQLVLPEPTRHQLLELTARVEHRARVMDEWGFEAALAGGRGVSALFAGPPGTGKTMAASVIAAELGLDLFAIDLSTVVSKYIGETEKNLSRVFDAAADSDAILFFDEADALFGKRSEVRDAHDRYANVEIAYLLQQMEQYEGLAVLATNLRHHLDDAFTRRIDVIVDFPFPDVDQRLAIWQTALPVSAPLADDIELTSLAGHRLTGGNIRNAVLGAAYLAAQVGAPLGQAHLIASIRRELRKMGKLVPEEN